MQPTSPIKSDPKSIAESAKRARALVKLSSAQRDLGAHEAALAPAKEAVDVYRTLAALRPNTYLADLASALDELSSVLGELGQHETALVNAMEAMDAYRRLVKERPETYLPRFALMLTNLSTRLRHLGRHKEALPLAQSAVEWLWPHYERSPQVHEKPMGTMFSVLMALHEDLGTRVNDTWGQRFTRYATLTAGGPKEKPGPAPSTQKSKKKVRKKLS
jgi:tetratricopeptide (TPR) repeat protein